MSLGVNIQWGYAGLFNAGIMGFAALGGRRSGPRGLDPPVTGALAAGGVETSAALVFGALVIAAAAWLVQALAAATWRIAALAPLLIARLRHMRVFLDPAAAAIEAIDPAPPAISAGSACPCCSSWPVGGLFAAGAA